MALSISIKKESINSDGTKITIVDDTGNYNASTNPGGYGSPNGARNSLALFLRAYAKRYNKTETLSSTLLTITPDTADKLAVASWDVTLLDSDSWIQATVYGLKLYADSSSVVLQVGELAWDNVSGQIKRVLTASGSGPYTYTSEVVSEDELEESGVIIDYQKVLNTYAIPKICECHTDANKKWIKSQDEDDWDKYQKIEAYLKAVKYNFGFGWYSEGQKLIETVEGLCSCLNENCDC